MVIVWPIELFFKLVHAVVAIEKEIFEKRGQAQLSFMQTKKDDNKRRESYLVKQVYKAP